MVASSDRKRKNFKKGWQAFWGSSCNQGGAATEVDSKRRSIVRSALAGYGCCKEVSFLEAGWRF
jgi:hypothetical protein